MEKKKIITVIILALCVAMIVAGLVLVLNETSHTGAYGGLSRASTSIKFGADFYTTSAQYTGLAANAAVDIYDLISVVSGIFFMFVGGMCLCLTLLMTDINELFGKKQNVQNVPVCMSEDMAEEETD